MTIIEIGDGIGRASVSLTGAELKAWRVGGVDLLWPGDPASWAETAPILFPIVGRLRHGGFVIDGAFREMPLHGFIRHLAFEVVERSDTRLALRCGSDARSSAMYPFDWQLTATFEVKGAELAVELDMLNGGAVALPYACGLHPGFRWPIDTGNRDECAMNECAIVFAEPEADLVPVISPDGLFTRGVRPVPLAAQRLPITEELMAREALCFLHAQSCQLRYECGANSISCRFDNFPHLALWSRAPGRFLCVECWTGHGDFDDAGPELAAKPSMCSLPPGHRGRHAARYTFHSASSAPS